MLIMFRGKLKHCTVRISIFGKMVEWFRVKGEWHAATVFQCNIVFMKDKERTHRVKWYSYQFRWAIWLAYLQRWTAERREERRKEGREELGRARQSRVQERTSCATIPPHRCRMSFRFTPSLSTPPCDLAFRPDKLATPYKIRSRLCPTNNVNFLANHLCFHRENSNILNPVRFLVS